MAITLAPWAIGKHISSVLLTPQTVNATTGVMSDTTPTRQFYAHLQEVELETHTSFENISPMDRPYENNVPIEVGHTLRITEHEKHLGTNLAAAAAFQATYWKFAIIRGAQTATGYGVLDNYKLSGTKPRVNGQIEFKAIDVNSTDTLNLAYI